MKKVAVYLRVSTTNQDLGSQEPDLKRYIQAYEPKAYVQWYRETFTGKTMNRPVMDYLVNDIKEGEVEKLIVWRLDRLGRTAVQMLQFLNDLDLRKVEFVSVKDGIDSSTASGRLMRTILAGFAEYEREVICERIRAGIAKAKAKGKTWGGSKPGHSRKLSPKDEKEVLEMVSAGVSNRRIAKYFSLNQTTIWRFLERVKDASKSAGPPDAPPSAEESPKDGEDRASSTYIPGF